jgi:hypothetical protein
LAYNYLPRLEEYNEIIHKKIHYGKYFGSFGHGTVSAGTTVNMYLLSPMSKFLHVALPNIDIDSGILRMTWAVGSSVSGGTTISVVNLNQTSNILSAIQEIKTGSTMTAIGTKLYETYIFGMKNFGIFRGREEYVLKTNTIYSLSIYNNYNQDLYYSYTRNWYETTELYNENRKDN